MRSHRHIKGKIFNKKGSYILEASITLPIFLIAVISLISVIKIISTCNNIVFNQAKYLREISIDTYYSEVYSDIEGILLKNEIVSDNRVSDFRVTDYDFMFTEGDFDKLIQIGSETTFNNIFGDVNFNLKVISRAFIGTKNVKNGLPYESFIGNNTVGEVVIFPRYGIRYHSEDCRYVTGYIYSEEFMQRLEIEEAKLRGYTPCLICNGGLVE